MVTQLLAVMEKELRQSFRDRRMMVLILVAPVVQLIVMGYAVDLDVDRIPTVVCDQDRSPQSRELAAAFGAEGTFRRVAETLRPEEASTMLETGEASVALILPVGLGADLERGQATVQVLIDGTDPNRAQIAANSASQFLAQRSVGLAFERLGASMAAQGRALALPQVHMAPRILYNPRLTSSIYMVPAVAAMVLLVVTTILTAMGIAREREIGTMEQILVTPLRPVVLLMGKCLPFAVIGLLDVAAILVAGTYLFHVPIRGSLALIFGATALYLMTTLGTGIFISTISRSQQQAILGGFFFILPAILLSGFMTPIDNMPEWIRPITYLNPVRYYVEILRGCLLKASTLDDLLPQMGALAIFGAGVLTLSALRFRKRLG